MKIVLRLILITVLAALGAWLWIYLHPSAEKIIRNNLLELARSSSFTAQEGTLKRVAAAQKIADSFSTDGQVVIDFPNVRKITLEGRDEIFQAVTAVRSGVKELKVEFVDLNVKLDADKKTAQVELTAKVFVPQEKDFVPSELSFSLKLLNGEWLITHAESVKVLK